LLSYSHGLVPKTRDFADSFSTIDEDVSSEEDVQQEHQNGDNEESLTQHSAKQQNLSYSHGLVPKTRDFADSFSTIDEDAPTTLMIRNIPNYYSQKELADEIDSLGFKGTYNFLYLPMDRKTNGSVGYCFVNFVDHHWAEKCTMVCEKHVWKKQKKRSKCAKISIAHLQGFEANVAYYRDKGVISGSGRQCGPWIVGDV
jgi:hypothetical protein